MHALQPFLMSKVKACVQLGSKYILYSHLTCFVGIEGRKQDYSLCNYRLVQNVPNYSLAAHHSLQTKSLLLGGLEDKSFTADQIITFRRT